ATLQNVRAMQRRFKVWADHAPMNYLHKWQLVEAERHHLAGRHRKAEQCYEESINTARSYGYLSDEALAHELAGRFFLARGKEINARMHLEQAHARYGEWGADGKVAQMEALYPALLARVSGRKRSIHPLDGAQERQVDVQTVIRASQTLSSEIHLDKLLARLMHLLIENAGAQKGALLMMEHGRLFVCAEINGDAIEVGQDV